MPRLAGSAALLVAAVGTAHGAMVLPSGGTSLDNILNGPFAGSFQVEDKRFDISSFSGSSSLALDILVKPVVFANPLDGIGFDLVFSNVSVHDDDKELGNDDGSPTSLTFGLDYTVTITEPGFAIKDALLAIKGSALTGGDDIVDDDDGNAFFRVTEEYAGMGLMQDLVVEDDATGMEIVDQKFFENNLQQSLDVMKDVELFAEGGKNYDGDDDDDGFVSVEFIRQTFSQVPAPGTTALLLAGGIAAARRRRA